MKLYHKILAVAAMALGACQYADAAVSFSVDLDVNADGIQNTRDAVAGEEIHGAIVLDITEDTSFSAYDLQLLFRQSDLNFGPNTLNGFVSDSEGAREVPVMTNRVNLGAKSDNVFMGTVIGTAFSLGPLTEDTPAMRPAVDSDAVFDSFGAVAGATLSADSDEFARSPNPALLQAPIGNIYLFSLVATEANNSSGDNIVLLAADNPFTSAQNLGVVSYNGARVNISAVPEPASLLVLAATTGIIGLRRRR